VRKFSSGSSVGPTSEEDAEQLQLHKAVLSAAGPLNPSVHYAQFTQTQVSTAAGVIVLAAAAVAVAWRVKE